MKLPSAKTLLAILAGTAIIILLGWQAFREPAQIARVATVGHGPLTQTIDEEGKTRLKQRYRISAPVAGNLRRISLQPGDAVSAGQILALIDPGTSGLLDARTRAQAEADLKAGQSQRRAARERIAAARAAHQLAQTSLKRTRILREANTVSQEALDQASTRAATTTAELAAAQAEEQAAIQRVISAQAILAQEGRTVEHQAPLALHAPVDGVVLKRPIDSAGPIQAGQLLMEMGDTSQLEIEADVLSTEAVRLSPGMAVRVLRWGGQGGDGSDRVLDARIRRIEPGGFTKTSALGVEEQRTRVIIDIDSPRSEWAALGDAYRVELSFILRHEDAVLQVPASALFRIQDKDSEGKPRQGWALYRVEEGRARQTLVKTGLRSSQAVQILEGVSAGDTVIVQPDDRIRDGVPIDGH
ncbi:MAG: HlyD family efflux transporter periplasmic adaptor subunit [Lautropia sp.]|nr:HlyD family efflux transporter periplasmic adaptor subunit [Lautropia sp.]